MKTFLQATQNVPCAPLMKTEERNKKLLIMRIKIYERKQISSHSKNALSKGWWLNELGKLNCYYLVLSCARPLSPLLLDEPK